MLKRIKSVIKKINFLWEKNDLVFFHFQGLRRIIYSFYYTNFSAYKVVPIPELKRLYSMYINKVDRKEEFLHNLIISLILKLLLKLFLTMIIF